MADCEHTEEAEDVVGVRNAINNIGIDDQNAAHVKLKQITTKMETDCDSTQNGVSNENSSDSSHSKTMTNGNIYLNEEMVHFECAKLSVQQTNSDNNNKTTPIYQECVSSTFSDNLVITEEIAQEMVISEEHVIYDSVVNEESVVRTNENGSNDNNDNSVCDDEECCESDIVTESAANSCSGFVSSIVYEGENSSLSESSSQQSSVSQTQATPNKVSNTAAMSVVQSFITACVANNSAVNASEVNASLTSQMSDKTNANSNSFLNKKKFGKFRILNNEQNNGQEENLNNDTNDFIVNSEENSIDSKYDKSANVETLSGSQSESSLHDLNDTLCDHSSVSPNSSTSHSCKSSKQTKRRGRPAGSTKKDKMPALPPQIFLEDDLNRRRSSRLKCLEERREQEKASVVKPKEMDENVVEVAEDHNTEPIQQQNDELSIKKEKKKKSKKDKTKKEKNKEIDSKKGKRKKKLSTDNDVFKNSSEDQMQDKCKMSENGKNVTNSECFTPPLPPSHYVHIKSNNLSLTPPSNKSATDSDDSPRPEKVKSRWRRNSELESGHGFNSEHHKSNAHSLQPIIIPKELEPPPPFDMIDDNIYLFERKKSKSKKETRRMVCDCILTKEERQRGFIGCGDDCLNRMLMIECGSRCSLGEHCANKRFQKRHNAKVEPFRTAKKGWGLRALEPLQTNTFIMEYIGEVVDPLDFHNRVKKYDKEKHEHHYFMALKSDEIIDATIKGNITRFVNHSCDPNSETQKWTVNGNLRIGFFTKRFVQAGEEITFDYQFQRYGKEAQKCYCESSNCRGSIGATDTTDIFTDGTRITPKQKIKQAEFDEKLKEDDEDILEDLALEDEIAKLAESGGLRNRQQVLMLARLMVRAEDHPSRHKLISIIKGTIEIAYLRLLLDYHGLQLIWSWMAEVEDNDLKSEILEVLEILPIPNKTMLVDSKVYAVVERWSQQTSVSDSQIVAPLADANLPDSSASVQIHESNESTTEKQTEDNSKETLMTIDDTSSEVKDVAVSEIDVPVVDSGASAELDNAKTNDTCIDVNPELDKCSVESNLDSEEMITDENIPNNTHIVKQELFETEKTEDDSKITKDNSQENSQLKEVIDPKNKLLASLIKPKSAINQLKSETLETLVKPKLSIALMAQKLMLSWKDLKEVFRIPRLERQKRHEDEKEADRRTKEVEERRAKGLPLSFEKRGTDDRDYTIAGILGIRRKGMKRSCDSKEGFNKKSNLNSGSANNQTQCQNNALKISKEEHRKMFEMEVAQRDYHEALKRYHQELAYYNAMYGQHYQQQAYSQSNRMREQYMPYNNCEQYYQTEQNYVQPNAYSMPPDVMNAQYVNSYENDVNLGYQQESCENLFEKSSIQVESSVLIPLANFDAEQTQVESSLAVDNIRYDDLYNEHDDIFNETHPDFDQTYPPPGVFYVTPDGVTYFTPVPSDNRDNIIKTNIFENVTVPHALLTNQNASIKIIPNWKHAKDKDGNIYYYNRTNLKSQWIAPEEDPKLITTCDTIATSSETEANLTDNECLSVDIPVTTEPKQEEIDEFISSNASITDEPLDGICNTIEHDTTSSSVQNSPSLIHTIIAMEADPRKRKQMLNSASLTTTAPADTSSSLPRKRSFSSPRKIQEHFRTRMSQYVIHCLNPYRKADCKQGRILNTEDFKYLARKLTHFIMGKEIKHCKSVEDLSCNEAVKHKTKDYVKKYMAKFGTFYKPDNNDKVNSPKDPLLSQDVQEND